MPSRHQALWTRHWIYHLTHPWTRPERRDHLGTTMVFVCLKPELLGLTPVWTPMSIPTAVKTPGWRPSKKVVTWLIGTHQHILGTRVLSKLNTRQISVASPHLTPIKGVGNRMRISTIVTLILCFQPQKINLGSWRSDKLRNRVCTYFVRIHYSWASWSTRHNSGGVLWDWIIALLNLLLIYEKQFFRGFLWQFLRLAKSIALTKKGDNVVSKLKDVVRSQKYTLSDLSGHGQMYGA